MKTTYNIFEYENGKWVFRFEIIETSPKAAKLTARFKLNMSAPVADVMLKIKKAGV